MPLSTSSVTRIDHQRKETNMLKWNAQIIIDSFNAIHTAGTQTANTSDEEAATADKASRFPSVDNILCEIHTKCETKSVAA